MKSIQAGKTLSSINMKSKKNSRDKEKRKSSGSQDNDKGLTTKELKHYAGINSESIYNYIEQLTYEGDSSIIITKEVCSMLKEDINYKLRHIIQDASIKSKLCGRNIIDSKSIEETLENFTIDKIYGASSNPNWFPFGDHNLLYLDDTKVNLIDIAEEEVTYAQFGNVTIAKTWCYVQEDKSPHSAYRNYFIAMCQSVINADFETRRLALKDISVNPRSGPIMEWFYHFGYFLLMKDVTYDSLTLYALDLIETLENSPLGGTSISIRPLKLLVRLLLQRLFIGVFSKDVIKPMCSILALLCLREFLKQMVIVKINQKLAGINSKAILPVLTAVYFLGIDAVNAIFLPNMKYFMAKIDFDDPDVVHILLAIYGLVCRAENADNKLISAQSEPEKTDIDFLLMKTQLLKTRRKVDCNIARKTKVDLESVFQIPSHDCRIRQIILQHRNGLGKYRKETHVIVGKTSLLLSVLKNESKCKSSKICTGHSLP